MALGYLQYSFQVARHSHLVDSENGPGSVGNHLFKAGRLHIEGFGLNIDKDRNGPTVTNGIGGGNKGVANGDHFIARSYPHCQQQPLR